MLSFFSCSRTRFRSLETSPLQRKSPICSASFLLCRRLLLLFVGAKFFKFLIAAGLPPNCSSDFCC
ncbi:hypothetical protein SLEP1_g58369 [Rubroshorea leprosula]|uniref:Uncharacterized protein n=1 Tax=Rubroshorea leprosula TaxID=152421 RepID=A0AAV5MRW3_9ROSI|nr:hypothetical protein SLEP1_g58369 [Rubroshorea leprosula]